MISIQDCIDRGEITILTLDGRSLTEKVSDENEIKRIVCSNCRKPMSRNIVPGCSDIIFSCKEKACTQIREENQRKIWLKERAEKLEQAKKDNGNLSKYGVPDSHKDCSFDNFNGYVGLVKDCKTFVKDAKLKTLLITGGTGSGKTHLAIGILKAFREKGYMNLRFERASMIILKFRNTYGDAVREQTEYSLINDYSGCSFLVIDDLGTETMTDTGLKNFQIILENRISTDNRYTVITTNLPLTQIEDIYGSRIASRLNSVSGMIIKNNAPDYRTRKNA